MDRYERLFDVATTLRDRGADLSSERVYFTARDPITCAPTKGDKREASRGRQFWGKISRGKCVDAEDGVQNRIALVGRTILYFCDGLPPRTGTLYSRSRVHRGHHGLLQKSVHCEIVATYSVNER